MIRGLMKIFGALLVLVLLIIIAMEYAPPRWVAKHAQAALSERTNADVSIEAIDLHLIGAHPSVHVTNLSISDPQSPQTQARAQLASFSVSIWLRKLLEGELYINEIVASDGSLVSAIDSTGRGNWQYLFPQDTTTDSTSESIREPSSLTLPTIEQLLLEDLRVELTDEQRSLDAQLQIAMNGSTLETTPTTVKANGTLNALPAELEITTNLPASVLQTNKAVAMDLGARIGDSDITVEGSVADLASFQDAELSFSTSAPGLDDVEVLTGLTLPVLPPVALSGRLRVEGSEFVLQRFDGTLGDSDVQGDIRVDPSTSPPTLYANVISTQLDLDDLAGLVGSEPDPTETASGQQDKETADESSQSQSVLASDPIALATLASFFNGAIEYRADAIESLIWPVQSLDIRTEIQGTDVTIEPLRIGVADGDVSGSFSMSTASVPVQSELTMRIQGVNIKRLLSKLDIDDESFGILGGRLKYWIEGDSIADMAASADGGLFLLMTQGKLDALLAELAGVDLLESLVVLIDPEQSRTNINCAYLDLQSANGVSDIATLVLDTNDAVFLADGSIDLNDETVDIIVEPHPKDASILAAQTAVHIGGTLSDFSVRPGQTLYARAAAAAILATVASPAAALLPFIEAGTGSDSAYCDGMITALDDARE